MTGNYDLRVCDETNVYSIRIYRLEEAETEQNHGQPNESFCTHTQMFFVITHEYTLVKSGICEFAQEKKGERTSW